MPGLQPLALATSLWNALSEVQKPLLTTYFRTLWTLTWNQAPQLPIMTEYSTVVKEILTVAPNGVVNHSTMYEALRPLPEITLSYLFESLVLLGFACVMFQTSVLEDRASEHEAGMHLS